jgi:hypothetical protein
MAQQDTTPTAASVYRHVARDLLYPILFAEAVQAADRLQRLCNSEWKSHHFKDTPKAQALMLGVHSIEERAHNYAKEAADRGTLLLCWAGSRVVQHRAEVLA